jgi:hypothetical protein
MRSDVNTDEITARDLQSALKMIQSNNKFIKSLNKQYGTNINLFVVWPKLKPVDNNMLRYEDYWWELIGESVNGHVVLDSNKISKLGDSDIPYSPKEYVASHCNAVLQFTKPYKNSFSIRVSAVYSEEFQNPDYSVQKLTQFIVFFVKINSELKMYFKTYKRGPMAIIYW